MPRWGCLSAPCGRIGGRVWGLGRARDSVPSSATLGLSPGSVLCARPPALGCPRACPHHEAPCVSPQATPRAWSPASSEPSWSPWLERFPASSPTRKRSSASKKTVRFSPCRFLSLVLCCPKNSAFFKKQQQQQNARRAALRSALTHVGRPRGAPRRAWASVPAWPVPSCAELCRGPGTPAVALTSAEGARGGREPWNPRDDPEVACEALTATRQAASVEGSVATVTALSPPLTM